MKKFRGDQKKAAQNAELQVLADWKRQEAQRAEEQTPNQEADNKVTIK